MSASWFGCGDGLQFQRKMVMKCIVNDDVDKVQDTRIFPKSRHLPMPPYPQSPQLLKKLVGWQKMSTWWVNIMTIFHKKSSGHLVTWSFGHFHRNIHTIFGHYQEKNEMWSRWQAQPWDWLSKDMSSSSGMCGVCGYFYITMFIISLVYMWYILRVSVGILK